MSLPEPTTSAWKDDEQRPLHFSSWLLIERRWTVVLLLLTAAAISIVFGRSSGHPLWGTVAFGLFLLSIWRSFVKVHFEINANGIVRWTFGRKTFIAWEEIRSYRQQPNGILMFPHADRYPLESFRSFFLPVPELLREDIQNRFVFFVDRIVD